MTSLRAFTLFALFTLTGCQGVRFYWETKFHLPQLTDAQKADLFQQFNLTEDMNGWHPAFGKHCAAFPMKEANLFACHKGDDLLIVSSYPGNFKGDRTVITDKGAIAKYLEKIKQRPGFPEHQLLKSTIARRFRARVFSERLMMYEKGSLLLKNELEAETFSKSPAGLP